MRLNITFPGFGGGKQKQAKPEAQPIVKRRYWTPDENDVTLYKGEPGFQGENPEGYDPNDAWYKNKVYDKKTGQWVNQKKLGDDIYRTNDDGDILQWQPPTQPRKKGLLK